MFWAAIILVAAVAAALFTWPLWRAPSAGAAGLSKSEWRLAAGLAALVCVAALGAYRFWGTTTSSLGTTPTTGAAIAELAAAANAEPLNVIAWVRLGDAYMEANMAQQAGDAYQRANTLADGANAAALIGLASVLAANDEPAARTRALALLEQALSIEPDNARAQFYSALMLMAAGENAKARERFELMLAANPPDSVRTALERQIAALDQLVAAQQQPVTEDGAGNALDASNGVADPATRVALRIRLAPTLGESANSAAALFVFVQNPAGGPPLAVKRLPNVLPVELQLSAADAMLAGNAIQPGQNVRVVARLSRAGMPTAAAGDWYGEVNAIAGDEGSYLVVIDKVVQE